MPVPLLVFSPSLYSVGAPTLAFVFFANPTRYLSLRPLRSLIFFFFLIPFLRFAPLIFTVAVRRAPRLSGVRFRPTPPCPPPPFLPSTLRPAASDWSFAEEVQSAAFWMQCEERV